MPTFIVLVQPSYTIM